MLAGGTSGKRWAHGPCEGSSNQKIRLPNPVVVMMALRPGFIISSPTATISGSVRLCPLSWGCQDKVCGSPEQKAPDSSGESGSQGRRSSRQPCAQAGVSPFAWLRPQLPLSGPWQTLQVGHCSSFQRASSQPQSPSLARR